MPDDRCLAVSVASLKCCVSAGAGRNEQKAECKWIASRWQLADCLVKPGLAFTLRTILEKGATSLHELSAQQIKREKQAKKSKKPETCQRNQFYSVGWPASLFVGCQCSLWFKRNFVVRRGVETVVFITSYFIHAAQSRTRSTRYERCPRSSGTIHRTGNDW